MAEQPTSQEFSVTPKVRISTPWMRYWFAGFHPEGVPAPWPRHVDRAGTRVQWRDAFGALRTGEVAHDEWPHAPELNPFQTVTRDHDGLMELVPASKVFREDDPRAKNCDTCKGRPPTGFICGTCGNRG